MHDMFSASAASVASEASENFFWVFLQMCFPPQPRESGGGTTPQWGNVNRKPWVFALFGIAKYCEYQIAGLFEGLSIALGLVVIF